MLTPGRLITLLALALGVTWACSVDRRTDKLRCNMTSDCGGNGVVCVQGYCLSDSNCPDHCDTCDPGANPPTCTVLHDTSGSSFTCPSGYSCNITCDSAGACGSIGCQSGSVCDIVCSQSGACGSITCNGQCNIHCIAPQGCKQVNCSNACACDVACAVGDCQTLSCPRQSGNTYCTATGSNNQPCESTPSGCNKC